ncbi:MAG: MFS transporter, partial [Geminicoccaceae bacterium]
LGAAVLGSVLNLSRAHGGAAVVGPDQVRRLLEQPGGGAVGDLAVRAVLHHALHLTFWAVLLVTVITLLLATLVPSVATDRGTHEVTVGE